MGHSPSLWATEGSRQLVSTERELGWVFMERRSMELADTAVCVSAHLLQWMREAGYALPARTFVWPNVYPVPERTAEAEAERAARDGVGLEEVVFFGRLEPRKGLVLFIDALDRLARQGRAPGRGGVSRRCVLAHRRTGAHPRRGAALVVGGGTDADRVRVAGGGGVSVAAGSAGGGTVAAGELLDGGDGVPARGDTVRGGGDGGDAGARGGGGPGAGAGGTGPHRPGRAHRGACVRSRLRAVRARWDFERSLEVLVEVARAERAVRGVDGAVRATARGRRMRERPLVTVCIVHHERPALVRMAVDSVYGQDYPALEAVLVDDGSEGEEALAGLEAHRGGVRRAGVAGW